MGLVGLLSEVVILFFCWVSVDLVMLVSRVCVLLV